MQNAPTSKSLKIGDYRVKSAPTGVFALDGGAMFGTVPKVLWEKTNPADSQNRIQMEARTLLLLGEKHKVLIDTGIGSDFVEKYGDRLGPKFAEMYAIDRSQNSIAKTLADNGLSPNDITDVILTHLHFDHAGGATKWDGKKLVPSYPNAQYYVQKKNLETARHPNVREKASYFSANFEPLLEAGCLNLLDGNKQDLLPGVSVELSHGHTLGQQIVKVTDDKTTLVYCADLIPTSSHVRLPWVMGYDLNPLLIIEEKQNLLNRAAQGNWYLFFEHDPDIDAAQVEAVKADYAVSSRVVLI